MAPAEYETYKFSHEVNRAVWQRETAVNKRRYLSKGCAPRNFLRFSPIPVVVDYYRSGGRLDRKQG